MNPVKDGKFLFASRYSLSPLLTSQGLLLHRYIWVFQKEANSSFHFFLVNLRKIMVKDKYIYLKEDATIVCKRKFICILF